MKLELKEINHSFTLVFVVLRFFLSVQIKANCRSPGDINYGLKIGNNYKHGKTVRYSCNSGFTLEGEADVTCEEHGILIPPSAKVQCVSVHVFVFRDI